MKCLFSLRKGLFFLLFSAVLSVGAEAQISRSAVDEAHDYFARMVTDWDVPGMSIAVVRGDEIVFSGGYGIVEIGKEQKPDEHTLYATASNSKAFTAALIGMLVDEGKLDWDDKVIDHVPYFRLSDPWVTGAVTIRDLLCHRVGLGTFSGDVLWYKSDRSAAEIIERIPEVPVSFEFRSGFGYSNLMYITAGEVIRSVTGNPWHVEVKRRILNPAGMSRTRTSPDALTKAGNFATPHARIDDENVIIEWEDWEEIGALGGIISSVSDMAKWMRFNMNRGVWNGDTLLQPQTHNVIWTPHNNFKVDHTRKGKVRNHFNAYGLGWRISDHDGLMRVGHTGGYDGMISAVTMIPEEKLGIVVLTNGVKSPIRSAVNYLLELFLTGEVKNDWSAESLSAYENRKAKDTRVKDKIAARKENTNPSLPLPDYAGTYRCEMYGEIEVLHVNGDLRIDFERAPDLSATLKHWHRDVFKLEWDRVHAWFDFGTVRFALDNDGEIEQLVFDVPNDDIFFHEIKAVRE